MTIIIIIFIVLFIIGIGSSNRSYESNIKIPVQSRPQAHSAIKNKAEIDEQLEKLRNRIKRAKEMKELEAEIESEIVNKHKQEAFDAESFDNLKKSLLEGSKQTQPAQPKSTNESKYPPINTLKVTSQETPAQAVIREFKNRNVTSLWHMTHKDNVASILKNGISSKNKMSKSGEVVDISNPSVQALRVRNETIYNRSLHDYAPTYINIRNPMLYVKKDFNNDICLLEISIECLEKCEFVFTDGNAASLVTCFFNTAKNVESLPWDVLNADFWTGFVDGKRKRCAEILIHPVIKPNYIKRIHCYSAATFLEVANSDFKFELESAMYY